MKKLLVVIVAAAMVFSFAHRVRAQETQGADPDDAGFSAGVKLVMAPAGKFKIEGEDTSLDLDTEFAVGLSPFLDYSIVRYFSIGFGPQFLFHVKAEDTDTDSATEIDFNFRLRGVIPVTEELDLYAMLTPGYSIVIFPKGDDNPRGADLGIAGGGAYEFAETAAVFCEFGYQFGWQKPEDIDLDMGFDWFLVTLGVSVRL